MMSRYCNMNTTLRFSHMMRHQPCWNAAQSDVLARLSAGFFFGLRCTENAMFGYFPRFLHLLLYCHFGYELFPLFEICSWFHVVILFGDFVFWFSDPLVPMQKMFCVCLTERDKLCKLYCFTFWSTVCSTLDEYKPDQSRTKIPNTNVQQTCENSCTNTHSSSHER